MPLQNVQYEAAQSLLRSFIDREELAPYLTRIIYDNRKQSAASAQRLADMSPHPDAAGPALYHVVMIKLNAARQEARRRGAAGREPADIVISNTPHTQKDITLNLPDHHTATQPPKNNPKPLTTKTLRHTTRF